MRPPDRGFTLVELIIVVAIVGLLASAALPLARWSVKRGKEHELQQNLRILRIAIDRYQDAAAAGLIEVPEGTNGFPASLEVLVEGVPLIAPMPVPFPALADEYAASGPGLTGGLPAQVQAGQEALGGGLGAPGGGVGGAGAGAAASGAPGGRNLFSSSSSSATSGFGAGARPAGSLGQQQTTGFGQGGRADQGASGFGQRQQTGNRQPGLGGLGGQTGFGAGGGDGPAGQPAQPILGPDGQPVMLVLLRRVPIDPFTGDAEWGLRCYGEPPEDRLWCGRDVFDVYSKSFAKAIDGTNYRDW